MKYIGVYGTLKQGEYNNDPEWKLVTSITVEGAMTLVHNSYPKLWRPDDWNEEHVREHELQILEVDDYTFERVDLMERYAGYTKEERTHSLNDDSGDKITYTMFWAVGRPDFQQPWIEGFPCGS